MARKPRFEIENGLYHVITRGVDRRDISHSRKFEEIRVRPAICAIPVGLV